MEILGEGALGFASWVVSVALRGLPLAAHNVSADTVAGVVWPGVGEGVSQLLVVVVAEGFCRKLHHHHSVSRWGAEMGGVVMESMSSNDSCSLVGWAERNSMTPAAPSLPPPQGVER